MSLRILTLAAAGLALSGCVSLFPKAEPAGLYDLELTASTTPAAPPTSSVLLSPVAFTRTSANDSIITVTGSEVAAIAGARWAAPAQTLFEEALVQGFDGSGATLVTRGSARPADMALRVEVRTFEARYMNGREAAPTVVVEARALVNPLTGREGATQTFRAEQPASENRVGPIVDAYSAATSDLVRQIAAWTAAQRFTN